MKERAMGMTCHIREGSAARNLEMIVKGIVEMEQIRKACFAQMISISKTSVEKVTLTTVRKL